MSKPVDGRHRMWRIAACWLLLGYCPFGLADYRVELDGSYAETTSASPESDILNFSIEVFLQPVDDSKGPLGEAAFLSRASSLQYRFDRVDIKLGENNVSSPFVPGGPAKSHRLAARYVAPQSGWIFTALAERPESRLQAPSDDDAYRLGVGFGRYLSQTTTVEFNLDYRRNDADLVLAQDCPFFFTLIQPECDQLRLETASDQETLSAEARLRRVGKIGSQTFATSLLVGYTNADVEVNSTQQQLFDSQGNELPFIGTVNTSSFDSSIDSWNASAAGTWFVTRHLGIDASWTFVESDLDAHILSAGVGWFVSPRIELSASFQQSLISGISDSGQWRATVRARF